MRRRFVLALTMFIAIGISHDSLAQVEINTETSKKEKKRKKKEKKKRTVDGSTSVFGTANWSYTTRKLEENDGLFGDQLGERANETSLNTWSFELGLRNVINDYLSWEGGIAYLKNGEKYSFEDVDSSYAYTTKYSYIGMPLKLYFTYGKSIKLLVGGGIVPQMFIGYRQDREWTTSLGTTESETFKTKNGYNSFVLSAVANIGIQFHLGKRWHALVVPEYRIQLTNSDEKNSSYKHYGRALGFNFGVMVDL